ncbi:MAG: ABC transporter ATP-binding protein [Candidatus Omnitrophica bacterium]|nr:ABC transporter ATP-binding protein [Candidatus Omnitrophota bacterium]
MTVPYFRFDHVSKRYAVRQGVFRRANEFAALGDVDFALEAGLIYGLVGESGSGKSTAAKLMMGLERVTSGTVYFEGTALEEVLLKDAAAYRRKVQMVFQNPYSSLDPRWTVRALVAEGIGHLGRKEMEPRAAEALRAVRLDESFFARKTSQMSGGERQRVAIARALAMRPDFLILDEPTSQLDVSVQFEIICLLEELKPRLKGGILFITHDIALVSRLADRILVFRAGRLVEQGPSRRILDDPESEYTKRLLAAVPKWP